MATLMVQAYPRQYPKPQTFTLLNFTKFRSFQGTIIEPHFLSIYLINLQSFLLAHLKAGDPIFLKEEDAIFLNAVFVNSSCALSQTLSILSLSSSMFL